MQSRWDWAARRCRRGVVWQKISPPLVAGAAAHSAALPVTVRGGGFLQAGRLFHYFSTIKNIAKNALQTTGEWTRFSTPMRTGAPFFLFERRFRRIRVKAIVCGSADFFCPKSFPGGGRR